MDTGDGKEFNGSGYTSFYSARRGHTSRDMCCKCFEHYSLERYANTTVDVYNTMFFL